KNNTGAGISSSTTTSLTMTGGEVSGNGQEGIVLSYIATVKSIKLRGVSVTSNGRDGISILGDGASSVDLGKIGSPGNNTSRSNGATYASLHLWLSAVIAYAVGNTWTPNTQGSDAAGHYAPLDGGAVYEVFSGSGMNYNVGAGALRLAEQ